MMYTCAPATCADGMQNGNETGVDCGGSCPNACPTLVLLGGGTATPNGLLGASYDPVSASWTTTPLAGRTVDGVALAFTGKSQAVALYRHTELGSPSDNLLEYATWNAGTWSSFAPVGMNVTTRAAPTLGGYVSAGVGDAAFQGFDFKHYYLLWAGGTWSPVEPAGNPQSFGPQAPAIASLNSQATLFFANGGANNHLYAQDRAAAAGAFGAGVDITASIDFNIAPSAAGMRGGPMDTMVVFVQPGGQIAYTTRTTGMWQAVATITGATTGARVALAPLDNGNAILAFRGNDGNLYVSWYTSSPAPSWSAPTQVAMAIDGVPAVLHGIFGASAELAYVKGGEAWHTRYVTMNNAWTTPAKVGGSSLASVALAGVP
jgi:hypothetical protein